MFKNNLDNTIHHICDNCIKYAIKSSQIDVDFNLTPKELRISISSEGPKVGNEELVKLTQRGFRGENAKMINPNGKGLGLYYLNTICNLCKANLTIRSLDKSYFFNETEYSTFIISIDIPLTPLD
jgi:signal transduction histidine kinase